MKRHQLSGEELARRKEQRRRSRLGLCWCCGGSEFVDAVDNRGEAYKGCARCVIVLPPELRKAVHP
jgi:hypothetical protein